jgi:hypothetical protein
MTTEEPISIRQVTRAVEALSAGNTPLAPPELVVAQALRISRDDARELIEENEDIARAAEAFRVGVELEIYDRWAAGHRRDSTARELFADIRPGGGAELDALEALLGEDVADE